MLSRSEVTEQLRKYVCVAWNYDGLNGSVIRWTNEHGNTHHDPAHQAWILDAEGEEIARPGGALQSASGLARWLEEHSKTSFPLVDPAEYPNLRREAADVARRRNLGRVLSSLRETAGDEEADAVTREEANSLLEQLEAYAKWKLGEAESQLQKNPARGLALYGEVAGEFRGDEIGDQAKEVYDRLRRDRGFQKMVRALESLQAIEQNLDQYRRSARAREQVEGKLDEIIEEHPDSAASRKAQELKQALAGR